MGGSTWLRFSQASETPTIQAQNSLFQLLPFRETAMQESKRLADFVVARRSIVVRTPSLARCRWPTTLMPEDADAGPP
jgi:hypothetical protein